MEELYYFCDFKGYTKSGKQFQVVIRPGQDSEIVKNGYLYLDSIDPNEFYEICGLKRLDRDFVKEKKEVDDLANFKTVIGVATYLLPIFFLISDCKPLMWVCGPNAVSFYKRFLGRNYKVEILRGSLSKNSKYPPLKTWSDETGGSEDEHIIRLSLIPKSSIQFLHRFPKLMSNLYRGFSHVLHKLVKHGG